MSIVDGDLQQQHIWLFKKFGSMWKRCNSSYNGIFSLIWIFFMNEIFFYCCCRWINKFGKFIFIVNVLNDFVNLSFSWKTFFSVQASREFKLVSLNPPILLDITAKALFFYMHFCFWVYLVPTSLDAGRKGNFSYSSLYCLVLGLEQACLKSWRSWSTFNLNNTT